MAYLIFFASPFLDLNSFLILPLEIYGLSFRDIWAFPQLVKNLSAMQETWVQSLGWGLVRSPGEGKGYPLQYSGLENSMDCISMRSQRVRHNWATFSSFHFTYIYIYIYIKLIWSFVFSCFKMLISYCLLYKIKVLQYGTWRLCRPHSLLLSWNWVTARTGCN